MRMLVGTRLLVLVSILLVAGACGGGSGEQEAAPVAPTTATPVAPTTGAPVDPTTGAPVDPTTGAPVGPATAQSCDELADVFLSINQRFLDDLGDMPAEEFGALMQPLLEGQGTLSPPLARLTASTDLFGVRMGELACIDEEMQRLLFSRADRLQARGTAGELWISNLTGEDGPGATDDGEEHQREPGPGSDWIDEPLPPLEDLINASNCEDFMRMLVGVENERFRLKEDVTAADDAANNYTRWDFDEYDVFADLQTEVGCGDLEFSTALDNARFARCDRWVAEGHSPDEEPLMLNTDQCY